MLTLGFHVFNRLVNFFFIWSLGFHLKISGNNVPLSAVASFLDGNFARF